MITIRKYIFGANLTLLVYSFVSLWLSQEDTCARSEQINTDCVSKRIGIVYSLAYSYLYTHVKKILTLAVNKSIPFA